MKRCLLHGIGVTVGFLIFAAGPAPGEPSGHKAAGDRPKVVLSTTLGEITVELYSEKAPVTVENFVAYVDAGFYDGTIFHRIVPGFVIQGGGLTAEMDRKPTRAAIRNEADNGLKNARGTLAMARAQAINSATSQFFISLKDNPFLDHSERSFGYAVFGRVIGGMEVVDRISTVPTHGRGGYENVPVEPVVIRSARRK